MISPARMTGRRVRNVRLAAERSLTDSKAAARGSSGRSVGKGHVPSLLDCFRCDNYPDFRTVRHFSIMGKNVPQRLKLCPSRRPGSRAASKTLPSM
jgi:hypothetical protein